MAGLPNSGIKIGDTVTIKDGVFAGFHGKFMGYFYKYNHGWRCRVDIGKMKIEFILEQIYKEI